MGLEIIDKLQPFAIALAIGLLIGIERERSHPPGYQALGLRTFVLLSLLGAISARFTNPWIAVSMTIFVGAAAIAGYLRSSRKKVKHPDVGITTEIAAVVTYGLGFLAFSEPFISLLLGVIVLVVLMARTRLHKFSRNQLRPQELQATAILLVLALGILPFLPDRTIDPWDLFNPQRLGLLVLIIALLQFAAYAGIRIFGATKGILLSGFLAGFVSSTAATATLSHQAKKKKTPTLPTATALILATVAMFIEIVVVIAIIAPKLLEVAGLPIIIPAVIMGLIALGIGRYATEKTERFPAPKNPLAIGSAFRLAFFLAMMLVIVTLAERLLGHIGARFVIFLGGLVEIHGVVLAISTLFQQGKMTAIEATTDIGLAIFASFLSKYIIAWTITRSRFSIIASLMLGLMVSIFGLIWGIVVFMH